MVEHIDGWTDAVLSLGFFLDILHVINKGGFLV